MGIKGIPVDVSFPAEQGNSNVIERTDFHKVKQRALKLLPGFRDAQIFCILHYNLHFTKIYSA